MVFILIATYKKCNLIIHFVRTVYIKKTDGQRFFFLYSNKVCCCFCCISLFILQFTMQALLNSSKSIYFILTWVNCCFISISIFLDVFFCRYVSWLFFCLGSSLAGTLLVSFVHCTWVSVFALFIFQMFTLLLLNQCGMYGLTAYVWTLCNLNYTWMWSWSFA